MYQIAEDGSKQSRNVQ